jgi:hypothetical protein
MRIGGRVGPLSASMRVSPNCREIAAGGSLLVFVGVIMFWVAAVLLVLVVIIFTLPIVTVVVGFKVIRGFRTRGVGRSELGPGAATRLYLALLAVPASVLYASLVWPRMWRRLETEVGHELRPWTPVTDWFSAAHHWLVLPSMAVVSLAILGVMVILHPGQLKGRDSIGTTNAPRGDHELPVISNIPSAPPPGVVDPQPLPRNEVPIHETVTAAVLTPGAAADRVGKQVLEGRNWKRPYTGVNAQRDAAQAFESLNEALAGLIRVSLADMSDGLSYQNLADLLETEPSTIKAYRMRLGRQAYHYGERINPLSYRSTAAGPLFYMQDATRAAFLSALNGDI